MPIEIADTRLYPIKELSAKLGVSMPTLRAYLKAHRLIGQKLGGKWFVSETNLREFLDNVAAKAKLAGGKPPKVLQG